MVALNRFDLFVWLVALFRQKWKYSKNLSQFYSLPEIKYLIYTF